MSMAMIVMKLWTFPLREKQGKYETLRSFSEL